LRKVDAATAVVALVDRCFEPTVWMGDIVDLDIEAHHRIPVPHPQFIHPPNKMTREPNDSENRAHSHIVVLKLLEHHARPEFQHSEGCLVEGHAKGFFRLQEVVFDFKTADGVAKRAETLDV